MPDSPEGLRAAITARLERVRGNLTDAEFAQLVEDVARTAERFDRIEARSLDPGTYIAAKNGITALKGPQPGS